MDEELKLKLLKQIYAQANGSELVDTLSKGALQLTQEQIDTVHFVFWLVYMAETDLNDVIQAAWRVASEGFSDEVIQRAKELLQEQIRGSREIAPENLEYFADKIKVYEGMYGKDDRTKLFWKLNDIRNDLSHNRIATLSYEGKILSDIETRRVLINDYFDTALRDKDFTKSVFWTSLSEEEKQAINSRFQELKERDLPK